MMLALARVPIARIVRVPRGWVPVALWATLAVVSAIVVRSEGASTGADHVMRGAFGKLALPLVVYALVGAAFAGKGVRHAVRSVVMLGAAPQRAAFALVASVMVASAVLAAVLAAVVCAMAHGVHDSPLVRDLPTSAWIGALAGAAYAAYFSAGAAIGNGAPRAVLLVVDWVVGASAGSLALATPRGHVQSLLGSSPVAEISQRTSSVVLGVLCVTYFLLAIALARRA